MPPDILTQQPEPMPLSAKVIADLDAEVIEKGERAAERVGRSTFDDWLAVGQALAELQTAAMKIANTNKPNGRRFNDAWATAVARRAPKLAAIDSATRSQAVWMCRNAEEVCAWHSKLEPKYQQRLNHPCSVARKFHSKESPARPQRPGLRDTVRQLQEQNDTLSAQVKTLEAQVTESVSPSNPEAMDNDELIAHIKHLIRIAHGRGIVNQEWGLESARVH